jgi:transposase-like protein
MAADVYYDVPEFTKAQRLDLAQRAWEKADSKKSIRSIAKIHDVNPETLRKRVNGTTRSRVEADHARQRLSVGEEESLVNWIKQLGVWGWPPRVLQLRKMAVELL